MTDKTLRFILTLGYSFYMFMMVWTFLFNNPHLFAVSLFTLIYIVLMTGEP